MTRIKLIDIVSAVFVPEWFYCAYESQSAPYEFVRAHFVSFQVAKGTGKVLRPFPSLSATDRDAHGR